MDTIDFVELKDLVDMDEVNVYRRLGWEPYDKYVAINEVYQGYVDSALHVVLYWPTGKGEPKHPEKPEDDADDLPW